MTARDNGYGGGHRLIRAPARGVYIPPFGSALYWTALLSHPQEAQRDIAVQLPRCIAARESECSECLARWHMTRAL